MLLLMLVPGKALAKIYLYDFRELAVQSGKSGLIQIPMTGSCSDIITNGQYGTSLTYGTVTVDFGRFGFRNNNDDTGNGRGWQLRNDGNNGAGLMFFKSTPEFAITNLKPEDEITIWFRGKGTSDASIKFYSGSATQNGNTLSPNTKLADAYGGNQNQAVIKATESGDIIISTDNAGGSIFLAGIQINRPGNSYSCDPAVETYDLTIVNTGENNGAIKPNQVTGAGFDLNNQGQAMYLTNLNIALNNRIAISQSSNGYGQFFFNNGLHCQWSWHNVSICNLIKGDRVKITFTNGNNNTPIKFASKDYGNTYEGSAAFKDVVNEGEFNPEDGDVYIAGGLAVENEAYYVMTEDGHLDLGLPDGAVITKIEIFCDRKAYYIDTDLGNGTHRLTFEGTGQLADKTGYIPGLKIEFGDADRQVEHFYITHTDAGEVSTGVDYDDFKMARRNDLGTDVSKVPITGTFYKFIPEISGKLKIDFKALSIQYPNLTGFNSDPENITSAFCPYVLIKVDVQGNVSKVGAANYANGAKVSNYQGGNIILEKGNTYYFYGWWPGYDNNSVDISGSCGVAQVFGIEFTPDFRMEELACVGTNGMTSFNGNNSNPQIKIEGSYSNLGLQVKRKSDNIVIPATNDQGGPNIYVDNNGYLHIDKINYTDTNDKDQAGVVIIEASADQGGHVFVLTIPYSAAFKSDADGNSVGHTWNFSEKPLELGNYFEDFYNLDAIKNSKKLSDEEFANASKNTYSNLYNEIHKADGSTDWTFTYRLVDSQNKFKDPMFQNVYDMVGDNADMIWETEGLWFDTPSNKSAIMNERLYDIDHSNETQPDPDRYVGVLPDKEGKSSFSIPALKKDDRVIIYMGSGNGSGKEAFTLNIENARDALYNAIDPNDKYHAGGSIWNDSHDDPYYHGCYHFFAKADGDMKFTVLEGSMVKLYEIQIYRGERRFTNSLQDMNSGGYLFVSNEGETQGQTHSYRLHYRGKGERLADGTGKTHTDPTSHVENNLVIASSGNITNKTLTLTDGTDLSYTNTVGEFGSLRVRAKCMEYNQNYVTDYADRNLTVGYKQIMSYPYTWDFTDMAEFSGTNIETEDTKYVETDVWWDTKGYDLSLWDANGAMVLDNEAAGPTNHNYIFQNNKYALGNQLYANNVIIPETKGLWFYMDSNDPAYSGSMRIAADGLHLANSSEGLEGVHGTNDDGSIKTMRRGWWNYKMVVPSVPAGGAVYLRVARDMSVSKDPIHFYPYTSDTGNGQPGEIEVTETFLYNKYQFAGMNDKLDIGAQSDNNSYFRAVKLTNVNDANNVVNAEDEESGDYIMAVYNSGNAARDLTFTLNGWVVKKMSVSIDAKNVNRYGWTTESRDHVIDPELTAYMTGYDFHTYLVTGVNYSQKNVLLTEVANNKVMRNLSDGQNGANIIYCKTGAEVLPGNGETRNVQILNGKFHLFVPDMHDYIKNRTDGLTNLKSITNGNTDGTNMLIAQVNPTTESTLIPPTNGNYTNYALTYLYYDLDTSGNIINPNTNPTDGGEAFYRIANGGASSIGNQGYLPLLTQELQGVGLLPAQTQRFNIVFVEEDESDTDTVEGVQIFDQKQYDGTFFYNLNGQKLDGKPTTRGIYIVNGKKVFVK